MERGLEKELGNKEVITALQHGLTLELTAVHQYLYHAALLKDWGIDKLAEVESKEAAEETEHANQLAARLLFLGAEPDFKTQGKLSAAETVKAILDNDLNMEVNAANEYRQSVQTAFEKRDFVTYDLFVKLLSAEEKHVDNLDQQLNMIKLIGIQNYIQSQS